MADDLPSFILGAYDTALFYAIIVFHAIARYVSFSQCRNLRILNLIYRTALDKKRLSGSMHVDHSRFSNRQILCFTG